MMDPENDWVKKRNTIRAIGRRTVLVANVVGQIFSKMFHLSKILEIVKLIEGASTLP